MKLQYLDPQGYKVETNQWLSSGKAMHLNHSNTVMVSEEDIYKLIFEWFSLDEAVRVSCEFARHKVDRSIDRWVDEEDFRDIYKNCNK